MLHMSTLVFGVVKASDRAHKTLLAKRTVFSLSLSVCVLAKIEKKINN